MDSTSSKVKIAFIFENVFIDGPALTDPWQAYVRVVGDFKIEVRAAAIYTEEQFCLVEFAIQSQIWSRAAALEPQNFTYTSMEAEEPGLVWFRLEQGGWKIGSAFQERECSELFSLGEIVGALDGYYERLRRCAKEMLHFDIAGLFGWSGVGGGDVRPKQH
ncbi:MAG: hypothetical protein WCD34_02345 [Candidatus Acidiferrum sp.]|jgi:hypothetical protein